MTRLWDFVVGEICVLEGRTLFSQFSTHFSRHSLKPSLDLMSHMMHPINLWFNWAKTMFLCRLKIALKKIYFYFSSNSKISHRLSARKVSLLRVWNWVVNVKFLLSFDGFVLEGCEMNCDSMENAMREDDIGWCRWWKDLVRKCGWHYMVQKCEYKNKMNSMIVTWNCLINFKKDLNFNRISFNFLGVSGSEKPPISEKLV